MSTMPPAEDVVAALVGLQREAAYWKGRAIAVERRLEEVTQELFRARKHAPISPSPTELK